MPDQSVLNLVLDNAGQFAGVIVVWLVIVAPLMKSQKEERRQWIDTVVFSLDRNSKATEDLTATIRENRCQYPSPTRHPMPPPPTLSRIKESSKK